MRNTVLFDLGNTLIRYFFKSEFPGILEKSIAEVQSYLGRQGVLTTVDDGLWQRVEAENHEAPDDQVRPLEGRLLRIFQLDPEPAPVATAAMCRRFLSPFFATARRYEDTLPTLQELKARGFKTAIVSNLPWGSPAEPWHEEVVRQGLAEWMDAVVFCTDVGWRKPARQIFEFTLDRLQVQPQECLFVGDNPRWDVAGPRALGIDAVLIDRHGLNLDAAERPIQDLAGLWDRL
jgi:putative hydrolase of the HAD superfamily